jgi:Zn-dependent peptidase ImmA (M78 family)
MTIDAISGEVKRIREKYDESDPVRLANAMGILLLYEPMGDHPNACKGFYLCQSRAQVITVNSSLPEELRRIILCHEIGHAVLHRRAAGARASGVREFHDFQLFDETSVYEYEANIFAADFLMEDDQVLSLLNDDISFFGAAAALGVPPELLDFKFRVLKRKGYKVIDPPIKSRGDFLKKIHGSNDLNFSGDDKS